MTEKNKPFINIPLAEDTSNIKTPTEAEFTEFKKKIEPVIGLNLLNYKNSQMERRITSLMKRNNIPNLNEYYKILSTDKEKLTAFTNMLTINVTEFFRNNEKYDDLEKKYLPELYKRHGHLKIWSAGCSCGAEIYSIAMILDKMNLSDKSELVASDFDINILQRAKSGHYTKFELGTVKPEYKKYFIPLDEKGEKFKVDEKLTSKVRFERRDLLNGKFEKDFNLILCRNVVIYFTDDAKDKLYTDFYSSLREGGLLLTGSTETIQRYREIGFTMDASFFYRK